MTEHKLPYSKNPEPLPHLENLQEVPGDGLPLPVGVCGQHQSPALLQGLGDALHMAAGARAVRPGQPEVRAGIHRVALRDQVAHMPVCG